jgi:hypothetical protein
MEIGMRDLGEPDGVLETGNPCCHTIISGGHIAGRV